MNIKNNFLFTGLLIIISTLITSCVGTIKNANPIVSKAVDSNDSSIQNYTGIDSVKTVAGSKIEVYFPPVAGDTDEIAYVIRRSGEQIPTYIQASALRTDYAGRLRYTISGLQTDQPYDFSVQARNIRTGAESSNNVIKSTRTFANATANFSGVTQVRNLPGADGLTGIEVFWNEAEVRGGLAQKDEIDPIEYKITVINSSSIGPGSMNDTSFVEPIRKVFSVGPSKRSAIVNGLVQDTKYFVQVRAIHHGTTLPVNAGKTSYKVEENNSYLEISTYSDDIANLNFDNSSFVTLYPSGTGGLSAINTSWKSPEGNFDHYRIYYARSGTGVDIVNYLNTSVVNPFCFGPEVTNTDIFCEYTEFSKTSRIITGLDANTRYDVILAVCITSDCTADRRLISDLRSHTTTPPLPGFSGIADIGVAKSLNELDKLFLNFTAPNFQTGNISGFIVEYYGSDTNNLTPRQLNHIGTSMINGVVTPDTDNDSGLSVDAFDYLTDESISVSGVDPTSIVPYCFLVYPFTFNNDGSKNLYKNGLTPKCKTPAIVGPDIDAFPGIANTTCMTNEQRAVLSWAAPNGPGIFNKYEIYYAKISGALPNFNFGAAVSLSAGYNRVIVNSSQTSITLVNFAPGETYVFGVLTRYQSIDGVVRSEFNSNIGTCAF